MTATARTTTLLLKTLAVVGFFAAAAPVEAQIRMVAAGNGARAQINLVASAAVPEIRRFRNVTAPTLSFQGERYTEYLVTATVGANTDWALTLNELPAGVTVLNENGEWVTENAVVTRGAPVNAREVMVRVRIADGASITWQQELRPELQPATVR